MHDDLFDGLIIARVHHRQRQVTARVDVHRNHPQLGSQVCGDRVENILGHPSQRRSGDSWNLHVLLERGNQVLFVKQPEAQDRLAERATVSLFERDGRVEPLGG